MKIFPLSALLLLTGVLLTAGCRQQETTPLQEITRPETTVATTPLQATARLQPTQEQQSQVSGQVTFTEVDGGVRVEADLQGLTQPLHGFHIHEFGDCSAPDASSAGGHFNPDGSRHGGPDAPAGQRHAGDLGNIQTGPDGTARYDRVDRLLQLRGDQTIIGKAVVVHAQGDDLQTDPTGASGARLACGVIEQAKNR
jgi:superoxide dismutase, Cu-Zn family